MQQRFSMQPRVLAVAVSAACAVLCSLPAVAQTSAAGTSVTPSAPAARQYNLSAGALGVTLTQIAQQSGQAISVDPELVRGRQAPAVSGNFTAAEAVRQAIGNNDLQLLQTGNGTLTLKRAEAGAAASAAASAAGSTLPSISVTGARDTETAIGPVGGYVARRSASSTKTDTSLLETPQSISIVTREEIRDRGLNGIDEVLATTAGVMAAGYGNDPRSDWLLVRGFKPTRFLDGLALPTGSYTTESRFEPYGLERVEVLKGPSSGLYGQVPPGGMVNMISKRPTDEPLHEIEVQVGNYGQKQVGVDLAGPVNEDKTVLYRLTALVRDSDAQVDKVKDKRYFIAPSITLRSSADTDITFLARFQKADTNGIGSASFLPAAGTRDVNPLGQISQHLNTGEPGYDYYRKDMSSFGYAFEHRFSDTLSFRQNVRYSQTNLDHAAVYGCGLAADFRTLNRCLFPVSEKSSGLTLDNQLEAKLATGAVRHTLLVGADYSDQKDDYSSAFGSAPTLDIFNPVYGATVVTPTVSNHTVSKQRQFGLYLQDQMKLDKWVLTASGREDWVRSTTDNILTPASSTAQSDQAFSGRLGLNYVFDSGISPYVAYSRSFQANPGVDYLNAALKPTTANQTEVGIKYQPPGTTNLITLALYDLTQNNAVTSDPLFQKRQIGETRVRGVELEGKTSPLPGLRLSASYAYTNSRIMASATPAEVNRPIPLVPKQQASAGADYVIQSGPLARLGFGGVVRYVGNHVGYSKLDSSETAGYVLFDASLRYTIERWTLQLNAMNVLDKRYVASCDDLNSCYYGNARTVNLTARYAW
jgi:iron complex outermembrane receptor protein